MLLNLNRSDLIDIIQNCCFPDMKDWGILIETDKLEFTGSQHNESVKWKLSYLEHLSDSSLVELYKKYKKK